MLPDDCKECPDCGQPVYGTGHGCICTTDEDIARNYTDDKVATIKRQAENDELDVDQAHGIIIELCRVVRYWREEYAYVRELYDAEVE